MSRVALGPWVLSWVTATIIEFAVPPAVQGQVVQVSVVTIAASDRHAHVDKKLECIAREIQKKEPSLTGFRVVRTECKSLPVGTREEIKLCEDQIATVQIVRAADKNNWVSLVFKPPKMGEVSYEVVCGKYFPILTRCQTKNGERLILAIMVRPCPKGQ